MRFWIVCLSLSLAVFGCAHHASPRVAVPRDIDLPEASCSLHVPDSEYLSLERQPGVLTRLRWGSAFLSGLSVNLEVEPYLASEGRSLREDLDRGLEALRDGTYNYRFDIFEIKEEGSIEGLPENASRWVLARYRDLGVENRGLFVLVRNGDSLLSMWATGSFQTQSSNLDANAILSMLRCEPSESETLLRAENFAGLSLPLDLPNTPILVSENPPTPLERTNSIPAAVQVGDLLRTWSLEMLDLQGTIEERVFSRSQDADFDAYLLQHRAWQRMPQYAAPERVTACYEKFHAPSWPTDDTHCVLLGVWVIDQRLFDLRLEASLDMPEQEVAMLSWVLRQPRVNTFPMWHRLHTQGAFVPRNPARRSSIQEVSQAIAAAPSWNIPTQGVGFNGLFFLLVFGSDGTVENVFRGGNETHTEENDALLLPQLRRLRLQPLQGQPSDNHKRSGFIRCQANGCEVVPSFNIHGDEPQIPPSLT